MTAYEKINIRGVDFLNVYPTEAAKVGEEMLTGDKVCTVFTPNAEIVQLCLCLFGELPGVIAVFGLHMISYGIIDTKTFRCDSFVAAVIDQILLHSACHIDCEFSI